MDALTPGNQADDFLGRVQAAQADLQQGIDRAGLRDDPFRHPLQALSSVMGLLPEFVDRLNGAIDHARQPVDPAAAEQAIERLEKAAAHGADVRAAELVRAHNRQTLLKTSGALALAIVAAVGGGFVWGWSAATASVHQTEQHLALAFQNGSGTAAAWANLMRSNDAGLALAGCTGSAVKIIDGRRACNVPLWLDPPSLSAPAGK